MVRRMASLILLFAAVFAAGCGTDSTSGPSPDLELFSLSPKDNQVDVSRTTGIVFTFTKKVDRTIAESGLRLISAKALIDSLCPTPGIRHGTMETAMHDASMMRHLDSLHAVPGHFAWSVDSLTLTFTPHSILDHHTRYMVHILQAMKTMMEQRLGDLGSTGQGGMRMSDMKFHFTTGLE